MDHKEFLHIYDNLNGFCEKQDENFPDQFEVDEELFRARDEIYAAKERLIEKYPDTEKDIYVITDNYSRSRGHSAAKTARSPVRCADSGKAAAPPPRHRFLHRGAVGRCPVRRTWCSICDSETAEMPLFPCGRCRHIPPRVSTKCRKRAGI